VEAKIDTGARTSALHANSIEPFEADGAAWVRFDVAGESESVPWHEAPVADRRSVRSSNGETEQRYVIRTGLVLAGRAWPVEISLTNRERMELPMLIGREALAGRVLVDAEKSWLWGRPRWRPVLPRRVRPAKRRGARSGELS
jgi:ribosomal protein S6--L-glutamate ligase